MFFWNSLVFFDDPVYIGNLISGSSAFYKTSLNIWKFTVCVLLKPGWRILSITLLACQVNVICVVVWTFLALPFFGIGMKTCLFQSFGHWWVFQICWHIKTTLTASSFRIWNSSAGIPSPPLALFIVMLPKAHLTSHSRMSGSRWVWWITPKREVYSNTILLQETRKISNKQPNFACKAVRKSRTNKSWSYKEEIINIKIEINETGKK